METRHLANWVETLKVSKDGEQRRAVLQKLAPLLEGLAHAENEILFPVLRRFLCFTDWMQEACAHHMSFRELMKRAHLASEHQRMTEITDELCDRLAQYLDGVERILCPRLVQALNRTELEELRAKLGRFWIFGEIGESIKTAA